MGGDGTLNLALREFDLAKGTLALIQTGCGNAFAHAAGIPRQYGAAIRIPPDPSIDDGLLDACIVHETTRLQLLKTLPLAYTGAHVKKPYVEVARGREFHFDSDQSLAVYADGEPLTRTPVAFGICEERLRVVVAG